jgi:type I restriction enzyme M protein
LVDLQYEHDPPNLGRSPSKTRYPGRPLILESGKIRVFDRVRANPRSFPRLHPGQHEVHHRFQDWCPGEGKKADLMIVQHMLARPKTDGHMATILPHGCPFPWRKEKLIREIFIRVMSRANISLPQSLFYGPNSRLCAYMQ